jgi:S1-C subfamily serine protease
MRLAAIALALALGAAGGGTALAQNWTYVAAGADNTQYSLDTSTIRAHGAYIESWQKQTPPRPAKLDNGKTYALVLSHRLDDCAAGTMTELDIIFADAKGTAVKTFSVPEGSAQFHAMPPGSIGQAVQAQVCGYARRLAALTPNLALDDLAKAEWISMGENPNYLQIALARESIVRKGAKAAYVTRSQLRAPIKNANGVLFRTAVDEWEVDCDLGTARVFATDYYDDNNQLVDVTPPADGSLPFNPINPNSPVEMERKIACSASAAPAEEDEAAQASSGTGWLGPKGYIVTANHVVDKAKVVGLAQDGKLIGTAEVVVADPANDVAILKPKLNMGGRPVIPLAAAPTALGEHVFTLGYPSPDDLGLSVKMTSGEVSSLNGSDLINQRTDDARLLQVSVPLQHGNSGGPIFNGRGEAVGVVVTGFPGQSQLQNVNYAIKVAYVRSLLADLPDLGGYRALKVSASIPGLVADLRRSVFMVVVAPESE